MNHIGAAYRNQIRIIDGVLLEVHVRVYKFQPVLCLQHLVVFVFGVFQIRVSGIQCVLVLNSGCQEASTPPARTRVILSLISILPIDLFTMRSTRNTTREVDHNTFIRACMAASFQREFAFINSSCGCDFAASFLRQARCIRMAAWVAFVSGLWVVACACIKAATVPLE